LESLASDSSLLDLKLALEERFTDLESLVLEWTLRPADNSSDNFPSEDCLTNFSCLALERWLLVFIRPSNDCFTNFSSFTLKRSLLVFKRPSEDCFNSFPSLPLERSLLDFKRPSEDCFTNFPSLELERSLLDFKRPSEDCLSNLPSLELESSLMRLPVFERLLRFFFTGGERLLRIELLELCSSRSLTIFLGVP
jgi:hypothetical protein